MELEVAAAKNVIGLESNASLLEALGRGPCGASEESRSREILADLAGVCPPSQADLLADSPGLFREILDRGPGERVALSDSEDFSEPEDSPSPPPSPLTSKGKEVALPPRKRRRARRHRTRKRSAGFMADARAANGPRVQEPLRRSLSSVIIRDGGSRPASRRSGSPPAVHPPRLNGSPDKDGFYEVRSRRFGRPKSPVRPRSPRLVPPELEGRCFRCLRDDHTRPSYTFPLRCYICWEEGHRAASCLSPARASFSGKWPRSPPRGEAPRRVLLRCARGDVSRASANTTSAASASTGRSGSPPPIQGPRRPLRSPASPPPPASGVCRLSPPPRTNWGATSAPGPSQQASEELATPTAQRSPPTPPLPPVRGGMSSTPAAAAAGFGLCRARLVASAGPSWGP